jgi:hypothetical protein
MTDYSRLAVEHALTTLTAEMEQEVDEALHNDFTAFCNLSGNLIFKSRVFRMGIEHTQTNNPEMRESLAAIVLSAAAILYEWDKRLPGS